MVHLETVKKLQNLRKKPAKQLPNLITISGGRREKSFRYNSEGLKNGKLIFLFFLQLKRAIYFQLGYSRLTRLCYSWILSRKKLHLKCFLLKLVVQCADILYLNGEDMRTPRTKNQTECLSVADIANKDKLCTENLLIYTFSFSNGKGKKRFHFSFQWKEITRILASRTMMVKNWLLKEKQRAKLFSTSQWYNKWKEWPGKCFTNFFRAKSAYKELAIRNNKTINRTKSRGKNFFYCFRLEIFIGRQEKV